MKIFRLFILGMALIFAGAAQAQISVRFNIGATPDWGPQGYSDVRYYYLPDVQAYYDIPSSMFIYYEGNSWVRRSYLPSRYRNYDLYRGYKVVMNDYHGGTPYRYYDQHRRTYSRGYNNGYQKTYGERPSSYGNRYEYNQVNRGRNDNHSYNREYDDRNYDKRGKEKYYKNNNKHYNNGNDGYNNGNNGYNNGNNGHNNGNNGHNNGNKNRDN